MLQQLLKRQNRKVVIGDALALVGQVVNPRVAATVVADVPVLAQVGVRGHVLTHVMLVQVVCGKNLN